MDNPLITMSRDDQITAIRQFGEEFREAGFELARDQDYEQDHFVKLVSYAQMANYWQVAEHAAGLVAALGAVSNIDRIEKEFYKDQAPALWDTNVELYSCTNCGYVLRVTPPQLEVEYMAQTGTMRCNCGAPAMGGSIKAAFKSESPF